ncbi:MAG: hypothetical protein WB392_08880 [Methanotrichaceae archaeon]
MFALNLLADSLEMVAVMDFDGCIKATYAHVPAGWTDIAHMAGGQDEPKEGC